MTLVTMATCGPKDTGQVETFLSTREVSHLPSTHDGPIVPISRGVPYFTSADHTTHVLQQLTPPLTSQPLQSYQDEQVLTLHHTPQQLQPDPLQQSPHYPPSNQMEHGSNEIIRNLQRRLIEDRQRYDNQSLQLRQLQELVVSNTTSVSNQPSIQHQSPTPNSPQLGLQNQHQQQPIPGETTYLSAHNGIQHTPTNMDISCQSATQVVQADIHNESEITLQVNNSSVPHPGIPGQRLHQNENLSVQPFPSPHQQEQKHIMQSVTQQHNGSENTLYGSEVSLSQGQIYTIPHRRENLDNCLQSHNLPSQQIDFPSNLTSNEGIPYQGMPTQRQDAYETSTQAHANMYRGNRTTGTLFHPPPIINTQSMSEIYNTLPTILSCLTTLITRYDPNAAIERTLDNMKDVLIQSSIANSHLAGQNLPKSFSVFKGGTTGPNVHDWIARANTVMADSLSDMEKIIMLTSKIERNEETQYICDHQ